MTNQTYNEKIKGPCTYYVTNKYIDVKAYAGKPKGV